MPARFAEWQQPPAGTIQAAADSYRLWLAPINLPSDDGRVIVDTLDARAGRLPIMFSDSEVGHGDAVHVGTFTDVRVVDLDGVAWVVSDAVVWDNDPVAVEARRMVDEGQLRGVSIHMGRGRFAEVCPNGAGGYTEITEDDVTTTEDPETGMVSFQLPCESPLWGAFDSTIAAVTIVAIPAFEQAHIEPTTLVAVQADADNTIEGNTFEPTGAGIAVGTITPVIDGEPGTPISFPIQAASVLDTPPADWFADPMFGANAADDDRLVFDSVHNQFGCPLTVLPDGRVFGHLALWRTCHTGYANTCVTVPRGADSSTFYQCRVELADGAVLPVGPLVVDEGHAPVAWSTDRVTRHYADTTLAAAYVRVGEDQHGIWVAGALSPRATAEMVDTLRRHSLSGDWRRNQTSGRYELVAAVSVNSPGFPVPQVLVASSGDPVGMISYGAPQPDEDPTGLTLVADALGLMASRLERLERAFIGTDQMSVELVSDCTDCTDADQIDAEPVEAEQPAEQMSADVAAFLAAELAEMLE